MKVCEKVESKQCTTYNEVADELVAELPRTTAASTWLPWLRGQAAWAVAASGDPRPRLEGLGVPGTGNEDA